MTIPLKANVAQIYRLARRYDEAMKKYRSVLELSPELRFLHAGLGHIYLEKGMPDEAISEFRKALELSGNDPRSEAGLARAYVVLHRFVPRDDCMIRRLKNHCRVLP